MKYGDSSALDEELRIVMSRLPCADASESLMACSTKLRMR